MATTTKKKTAAKATVKLTIKDLGKEVDKQEKKIVKGGVRVICYSGSAAKRRW